ncbi:hypothetical protein ACEE23_02970 [Corynebacterium sp. 32222D000AT]|uniref:hypothetical protein n=1 Tax=unclassified Corynebacterium TaxID=2624378 RepID=UPI002A9AC569|nr:hypothetical protein [Mycobacteriaceae bacterium]MDY5829903.1 hypothetical protein [Corynebacterium sp.]
MFDFLTDLSSAIDFEQLIKGISGLIDSSSEGSEGEGLSSAFEGLSSSEDSASEAAESTEAASE